MDKQGKGSGEGAVEKNTSRPNENKPSAVTSNVNKTKDSVDKILRK